ncbi:MAG: hypothetical protein KA080_03770 [Leptotrichiaceae bacterium]|nr:hypothetical protein [Leptotrichiaceae bacterium]
MKLVCLNSNFYNKYLDKEEILKKQNRPYVIFVVNINNIDWAIPFRSNIRHKYAYMTDKTNNNGIDFTKAVVIDINNDIDSQNVQIRQVEFNKIKGKEHVIKNDFQNFLKRFEKAINKPEISEHRKILMFSSLNYFIEEVIMSNK